jgi:spore coat polysaccharide biosynthesis protein SpsF
MKVVVITQARTGSTRLPNKVLLRIKEQTLLQIHINRIKKSKEVDAIVIATTDRKNDDVIESLAKEYKVNCYRGSEDDVLDRFYQAVKEIKPQLIVRLTSDCPLIDSQLIDEIIIQAKTKGLDYYANIIEERYPDGQDIEIFTFNALEKAWKEAKQVSDREHVTPYIRNNSSSKGGNLFTSENHNLEINYNHVRLTVDEPQDFEVMKEMIHHLGLDKDWKTYADYYLENEQIYKLNSNIIRNEGYIKTMEKDEK